MHSYMWAFGGKRTTPTGEDLAGGAAHAATDCCPPEDSHPRPLL